MALERVKFTRKHLSGFTQAVSSDSYHDYDMIIAAFRALPHQALTLFDDRELCLEFLRVQDGFIEYAPKSPKQLQHNYTSRDHIIACADGHIEATLRGVDDWEARALSLPPISREDALSVLPNWSRKQIERLPWLTHRFWWEWENKKPLLRDVYEALLARAEKDGPLPAGPLEEIIKAFELYDGFQSDPCWPECGPRNVVQDTLVPLLESEHQVYRNVGAYLLGDLCGLASADELAAMNAPSHTQIFELIADFDEKHGDIGAPFVDGARLKTEPVETLFELPLEHGFDVRAWLFRLSTQDGDVDPVLGQPLWFPMHEHFCADLDAAMHMVDVGKYFMAIMTAEEDFFAHMRPVVERIAREADDEHARWAQHSLDERWSRFERPSP